MGGEADGIDAVRQRVRSLIKQGADFIKIAASGGSTLTSDPYRPAYSMDELRAIVDEAHNRDQARLGPLPVYRRNQLRPRRRSGRHSPLSLQRLRRRVPVRPTDRRPSGRFRNLVEPDVAPRPGLPARIRDDAKGTGSDR